MNQQRSAPSGRRTFVDDERDDVVCVDTTGDAVVRVDEDADHDRLADGADHDGADEGADARL
eukprot:1312945-Prymnesium_polylepis.1